MLVCNLVQIAVQLIHAPDTIEQLAKPSSAFTDLAQEFLPFEFSDSFALRIKLALDRKSTRLNSSH